jgi:pyruvate formate lyase activating enzyme
MTTLERAREIGLQAGLRYVYLGNVPDNVSGHPGEHTFCPSCGTILIARRLLRSLRCEVKSDGDCPHCGQEIAGVGWGWQETYSATHPALSAQESNNQ